MTVLFPKDNRREEYRERVAKAKREADEYRAGIRHPVYVEPRPTIEDHALYDLCREKAEAVLGCEEGYAREEERYPFFGPSSWGEIVSVEEVADHCYSWATEQIAKGNERRDSDHFAWNIFQEGRRWALAKASGATGKMTRKAKVSLSYLGRVGPKADFIGPDTDTRSRRARQTTMKNPGEENTFPDSPRQCKNRGCNQLLPCSDHSKEKP